MKHFYGQLMRGRAIKMVALKCVIILATHLKVKDQIRRLCNAAVAKYGAGIRNCLIGEYQFRIARAYFASLAAHN